MKQTSHLAPLLLLALATATHAQTATPTPEQIREQRAPHEAAPLVHPITLPHKTSAKPSTPATAQEKTPTTTTARPAAVAPKPANKTAAEQPKSWSPAKPATTSFPVKHTALPAPPPVKHPLTQIPASQPSPLSHAAAASPATTYAVPSNPVYGPVNRTVIVLDPSHGGQDVGSRLSDNLLEKDVTLAFAFKLRSLLQARGFTVVTTRDSDSLASDNRPNLLSLDDRAGIANSSRSVACLLLHASGTGKGVHLYSSELVPASGEASNLPWLTAQAAWVNQSRVLIGKLASSLGRSGLPIVTSVASIRPVDSMTCPVVVVELAPKYAGDPGSINDSGYQQTAAEAIAGALIFWRNQMQPPPKLIPIPATTTSATSLTELNP